MSAEEQNEHDYDFDFGAVAEPSAGQVPGQGGAPPRESLADSPHGVGAVSARVPGQANAGQGGVTPEAFVNARAGSGEEISAVAKVPPPADPVDGDRPPSDAELTALVRAGDDTAYEEIYRRHAVSVRRYARTCCRDSFTAEDLAGEVFARTLQALRAGKGPEFAVRAYLLTSVRNVAAAWARSERREQLVDDFSVFAQSATASAVEYDLADPGADAWAIAEADQRMVMRAFVELPEDDRVLLWHTEVEQESPKTVAVLLGKTANATAVQAHRARSRLAAGFLQAHVSGTQQQGCEEYANRLGLYARGALRKRASGEVGRHLQECDRCTTAYLELADINHGLRVVLPTGALLWVGSGAFSAAAAALGAGALAGGAAAGGAAATAGATSGAGAAAGAGAGAGAGSSGGGAAAAAGEGLGTVGKAAIAATVAVAAAAAVAYALTGAAAPRPPVAAPPVSSAPASPAPAAPLPAPEPTPTPTPTPAPPPPPAPRPKPSPPKHTPVPAPPPKPVPTPPVIPTPPVPTPPAVPTPVPPPPVPTPSVPALTSYWLDSLPFSTGSQRVPPSGPSIDTAASDWLWQRQGLSLGGNSYRRGITMAAPSTVTLDLNRPCSTYQAVAGVDDLTLPGGSAVFSVTGDDDRTLWTSPPLRVGQPPVPVLVPVTGQHSIRLVVTPADDLWWSPGSLADWASARFTC
ncbi:RNA polymerase sigma factor (sigma-70 family) [Kitasatospora sp. MAP12-15]|uniref:sigma-70 family RNA polymerase sigma factor n=1 Tax=unclassified Kitasatospora TaxID=2633591 RepID=UPI002474336E|nr:sigma-70 family RNA polymerase sigma factor [Kitasatospora sp. MAP12-44]MDH6112189.1 RNA polymerase sigma factor (sigma-70 family) [Kitasatospora sp. MAP12-44]